MNGIKQRYFLVEFLLHRTHSSFEAGFSFFHIYRADAIFIQFVLAAILSPTCSLICPVLYLRYPNSSQDSCAFGSIRIAVNIITTHDNFPDYYFNLKPYIFKSNMTISGILYQLFEKNQKLFLSDTFLFLQIHLETFVFDCYF